MRSQSGLPLINEALLPFIFEASAAWYQFIVASQFWDVPEDDIEASNVEPEAEQADSINWLPIASCLRFRSIRYTNMAPIGLLACGDQLTELED
jgi:hypothetical protein